LTFVATVVRQLFVAVSRLRGRTRQASGYAVLAGIVELVAAWYGASHGGLTTMALYLAAAFALEGLAMAPTVLRVAFARPTGERPAPALPVSGAPADRVASPARRRTGEPTATVPPAQRRPAWFETAEQVALAARERARSDAPAKLSPPHPGAAELSVPHPGVAELSVPHPGAADALTMMFPKEAGSGSPTMVFRPEPETPTTLLRLDSEPAAPTVLFRMDDPAPGPSPDASPGSSAEAERPDRTGEAG
jgi:hypothetical protein